MLLWSLECRTSHRALVLWQLGICLICTSGRVAMSTPTHDVQDGLLLLNHINIWYPCLLQRWNSSLQTGHEEAAPARDASQCQDQWPDNATPLSCKPYFLKLYFLPLCFLFCNLLNSNFYTLKDNWVLIPLRSCTLFYFYLSPFFSPLRAHVVSEYSISFPCSFSY